MSQGIEHFSDVFFLGVALKIGLGWIAGQHSMETMFSDFCFGEKKQQSNVWWIWGNFSKQPVFEWMFEIKQSFSV